MRSTRISAFPELHEVLRRHLENRLVLYRGHNTVDWDLVPRLSRAEYRFSDAEYRRFLGSFKRRAVEYLTIHPQNEWDWLAVAQHHGLPTALLDWSYNPLVAAYFAAFPLEDRDCAIYAFYDPDAVDTETTQPSEVSGVSKIIPRGLVQRIVRQSGSFTFHNPPNASLKSALVKAQRTRQIRVQQDDVVPRYRRPCRVHVMEFPNRCAAFLGPEQDEDTLS